MKAKDLLLNSGDFIYLGSRRYETSGHIDRSFCCVSKILEIEMPFIKIETDDREFCLNLEDFPKWQKISAKMSCISN